jgi:hypothetical protein
MEWLWWIRTDNLYALPLKSDIDVGFAFFQNRVLANSSFWRIFAFRMILPIIKL